jgi:hypothetical protein
MKQIGIWVGVFVLLVVACVAIGQIGNAAGLWNVSFWGTRRADAERKVFVNTNSYVQGKVDYLSRLRLAYKSSDSLTQKAALKETILSEAANVDRNKLPGDLRAFINTLEEE